MFIDHFKSKTLFSIGGGAGPQGSSKFLLTLLAATWIEHNGNMVVWQMAWLGLLTEVMTSSSEVIQMTTSLWTISVGLTMVQ